MRQRLRQRHAVALGHVGRHDAGAARSRDHRDARRLGGFGAREELRKLE